MNFIRALFGIPSCPILKLSKQDETTIRGLIANGRVDIFKLRSKESGCTIFHYKKFSREFLEWILGAENLAHLFDIKDNFNQTVFHHQRYDEAFIKELLIKNPHINIFELKNPCDSTIFHMHTYSEEFIGWCLARI